MSGALSIRVGCRGPIDAPIIPLTQAPVWTTSPSQHGRPGQLWSYHLWRRPVAGYEDGGDGSFAHEKHHTLSPQLPLSLMRTGGARQCWGARLGHAQGPRCRTGEGVRPELGLCEVGQGGPSPPIHPRPAGYSLRRHAQLPHSRPWPITQEHENAPYKSARPLQARHGSPGRWPRRLRLLHPDPWVVARPRPVQHVPRPFHPALQTPGGPGGSSLSHPALAPSVPTATPTACARFLRDLRRIATATLPIPFPLPGLSGIINGYPDGTAEP